MICVTAGGTFGKGKVCGLIIAVFFFTLENLSDGSMLLAFSTNIHLFQKNLVRENDECQWLNGDCTTEKKCGY